MEMRYVVGIDIGATKTSIAAGDRKGKLFDTLTIKTSQDIKRALRDIVEIVSKLKERYDIDAVGIGCAGTIDPIKGLLVHSPNLKQWKNVKIANIISSKISLPVYIDNDCNVAVLAEYMFGESKGNDPLVYITISTGIGAGMIKSGEIYRGYRNIHQEAGHQIIHPVIKYGKKRRFYKCGCGNYNCLESFASGRAIKKIYGKKPERIKDERIWKEIAMNIAAGVYNIAVLYAPQTIVFGGSVVLGNGKKIPYWVKRFLKSRMKIIHRPEIRVTKLGKEIVLLGATALAYFNKK